MTFSFMEMSTLASPIAQPLVVKLNGKHARNRDLGGNIHSESALASNAQRRSLTKKFGGFLGGKVFDYFLTRFVQYLYIFYALQYISIEQTVKTPANI